MNVPVLVILMGLPGCGKSYLSEYLKQKYNYVSSALFLNIDSMNGVTGTDKVPS